MALTFRAPVLADRFQIIDIWNQNHARMVTYWPDRDEFDHPAIHLMPEDTEARSWVRDSRFRSAVVDFGGLITVMGIVAKGPPEDVLMVLMLRLDDATGTDAQRLAFLTNRLRTDGRDLMSAWARSARARGVATCAGHHPSTGAAPFLAMLDEAALAGGWPAQAPIRTGYKTYRATPTQLIAGMAAIV